MRTLPATLAALFLATLPPCTQAQTDSSLYALMRARVVQFAGTEAISRPYRYDVEVIAADRNLDFSVVVGKQLSLNLAPGFSVTGMVESIEQTGATAREGAYRIRLVPHVERLAHRSANRSFGDSNSLEIASRLLNEGGAISFTKKVSNTPPLRTLTIQYGESDLVFFSRLLEADGIHYHFEPGSGSERVVLSDSNLGFPQVRGTLAWSQNPGGISEFSRGRALSSGTIQAGGYNWQTPATDLSASAQAPMNADLELELADARPASRADSQRLTKLELERQTVQSQACSGKSTNPQVRAGYRFRMTGHPRSDFNEEYLVTAVEHEGSAGTYRNSFTCQPSNVVFRPPKVTPRPTLAGLVPGIVVGPPGEEIYVDEYGRVKVQFPWRSAKHSVGAATGDAGWVRVAQVAARKGTGALWLPRVGNEVAVAFEEGDPDRPVVVGSLYNAVNMPPQALPGGKAISLFKETRTKGGGLDLSIAMETARDEENLELRVGNQYLKITPTGIEASSPIRTPSTQIKLPTTLTAPLR